MEVANSPLDYLNQNECFDDCVACRSDNKLLQLSLSQDAECISEIFLDHSFGSDSDLVFFSLGLLLENLFVTLHI